MTCRKNELFGIHRTTQLVIALAITFGSFSVYKALGGGSPKVAGTFQVPSAVSLSGTALAAGVDVTVTNTNPLASAMRLTNAPRPAVRTTLTPIEQIQVGDRVLAESPTGEEDTAFGSDIIPADWRKLTLRAPKRDGTVAEVVLLRPRTWLNEQHGEVGGTVFISVPECGIDGNANVLAIDPCPEIPSGAGRVVTGTFLHQASSTITLTIADQSEPIECTGNHPFWSEDRQTFVRADSLRPNETLRTATGLTTVESWAPDLNPTPVYNIEVHAAHVYHIGTSGVLVHNAWPCDEYISLFHGTDALGRRSILSNGILPVGADDGAFFVTDQAKSVARWGHQLIELRVPAEIVHNLFQSGMIQGVAHLPPGNFRIDPSVFDILNRFIVR